MKIVIASIKDHPLLLNELMRKNEAVSVFEFVDHAGDFKNNNDADAFIDFSFEGEWYSPPGKPLLISETIKTLDQLKVPENFIGRFCGWKGFPERNCWEIATAPLNAGWINVIMDAIGKEWRIVVDEPGLVAPRIISVIINEAFFAWEEGVSSIGQVDKAMKLGTKYPEGPFEWGRKIGFSNIDRLLNVLAVSDQSYTPHPLLLKNNL